MLLNWGGLAVVGTERMPNSRVDWQLRGRSGRQGDPGLSQFFVSLEDELLIQHGGKWVNRYFEKNNYPNHERYGQPLKGFRYAYILNTAQAKSEDKAVLARESTIKFDESLRIQRNKIYALRDQLIYSDMHLSDQIDAIFKDVIADYLNEHPQLEVDHLRRYILENYSYQKPIFSRSFKTHYQETVHDHLWKLYKTEMQKKSNELLTQERVDEFLRLSVLRAIDECWVEQVDHLQQLKGFVTMRQVAQRDSISEYYRESLDSYNEMSLRIKKVIVRNIMLSTIEGNAENGYSIYFT